MLFSNISFIFIFLPVTVLLYFLVSPKMKNIVLVAASLVLYAWSEPVYVILLLLSEVFNYFCGLDIEEKRGNPVRARRSLIFAIVVNVVILVFFRYSVFIMESINALSPTEIPYRQLGIPVGIALYTMRVISYLVDVYHNEVPAQKKFVNLALYLSLFPQIPAGPVERYADLEKQLEERNTSLQRFGNGAMLFVCGLAKKVILADSLMLLQEEITSLAMGTFSMLTAWIGCAAFAFQIYFVLSGFTDMAVGMGRMFGFDLRRNFNYPYVSCSVTEFWKRWIISVAEWFRTYVYEPLGGARYDIFRQMLNLLIVGVLTGLWYGAQWRFVWWGIYFGMLLILERFVWGKAVERLPKPVQHIYAIVTVFIGWTFFFSPDPGAALDYISVMFGMGASALADTQGLYFILSHWLLLLLCVIGSSAKGAGVIRSIVEVPRSVQGKKAVVCVVYMGIFVISLAFLIA